MENHVWTKLRATKKLTNDKYRPCKVHSVFRSSFYALWNIFKLNCLPKVGRNYLPMISEVSLLLHHARLGACVHRHAVHRQLPLQLPNHPLATPAPEPPLSCLVFLKSLSNRLLIPSIIPKMQYKRLSLLQQIITYHILIFKSLSNCSKFSPISHKLGDPPPLPI